MERLILTCGRFVPAGEEDAVTRIRAMEAYLSRLAEELERLIAVLDTDLKEQMGEEE